jgi:hypothetical protein
MIHPSQSQDEPMSATNTLDLPEILKRLENLEPGVFPREALESASDRRGEITPHLLAILEGAIRRADQHEDCSVWMAPTYAMYLLAEFREPRAVPLIIRLISAPRDDIEGVLGEEFTDGLDELLAALCETNVQPLLELVTNKSANEYVRWNAMEALVILIAHERIERNVVVDLIERLFRGELERTENALWSGIACACHEIHPGEFMDELRKAYDEGLVNSFVTCFEQIEEDAKKTVETVLAELRERRQPLIQSAIAEMESWVCFEKEENQEISDEAPNQFLNIPTQEPVRSYEPPTPYVRPTPKVGRNDPCPCGSGRKSKRCCEKVV